MNPCKNNFPVSHQEWISCLEQAFLSKTVQDNKHGYLCYQKDSQKIQVLFYLSPSSLNIDKIVQISRYFLKQNVFSVENLNGLKKCYEIMQTSAARPKGFWSILFEKCVHFWRGEHFISTHTLLNQELEKIKNEQAIQNYKLALKDLLEKHPNMDSDLRKLICYWEEKKYDSTINLQNHLQQYLEVAQSLVQKPIKEWQELQKDLNEYLENAQNETNAYLKTRYLAEVKAKYENFSQQIVKNIPNYQNLRTSTTCSDELIKLKNSLNQFDCIQKQFQNEKEKYRVRTLMFGYLESIRSICVDELRTLFHGKDSSLQDFPLESYINTCFDLPNGDRLKILIPSSDPIDSHYKSRISNYLKEISDDPIIYKHQTPSRYDGLASYKIPDQPQGIEGTLTACIKPEEITEYINLVKEKVKKLPFPPV